MTNRDVMHSTVSHERVARHAAALLMGLLVFGLGQVWAQDQAKDEPQGKRIVVMQLSGAGAKHIQTAAIEILEASHTIIPHRDYLRVARQQKARELTPANVAAVAAELGADGVLVGEVARNGRTREAVLRLLAGKTGEEVAVIRVPLERRRPSQAEVDELRTQLGAAVDALPLLHGEPEPVIEEPEEEQPEPEPVPAAPVIREEPRARPAATATADRHRIELAVGLSFTRRTLSPSVASSQIDGPDYTGQPAPGLFVEAAVYPLAFVVPSRSWLGKLGIRATLDRVFALSSELAYGDPQNEMVAELGTTQLRMGVGLVVRHAFGSKPNAPALALGVGYDRLEFSVDRGSVPPDVVVDLPDVQYTSIDPSLTFRYPLSDLLAVTARGRVLLVSSTGDLEESDQYGEASAFGFDVGAELEYRVISSVAVRAGVRFMDIGTSFEGTGPLSNQRDDDPQTIDITGLTDRYLGGHVTAGYAF